MKALALPDSAEKSSVARRHTRYPVQLAVRLVCGNRVIEGITQDVSFSGLFVLHDDPPPLRSLVQVTVEPADEGKISLLAMPVHILGRGNSWGRAAGIGLTLYGNGGDRANAWSTFVQKLDRESHATHGGDNLVTALRGQQVEPEAARPRAHSVAKIVEMRFRSIEQLRGFVDKEVLGDGSMQIPMEDSLRVGSRLMFKLTHPISGKIFNVPAVLTIPGRAAGIEFVLDDDSTASLTAFVQGRSIHAVARSD